MFNALFSEAVRAAELQPVASIGPDADNLLAKTFVDGDLATAKDRLDAAQAAVVKHDFVIAKALEGAAAVVDDPGKFATAHSEVARQEFVHKILTETAATARAALEAAESESDRRKFAWIRDFQKRAAVIAARERAAFRKLAENQLLALARKIRALDVFERDAGDLHRSEAQRLSVQFEQK